MDSNYGDVAGTIRFANENLALAALNATKSSIVSTNSGDDVIAGASYITGYNNVFCVSSVIYFDSINTMELNSLSSIRNGSRVFGINSNELYIENSSLKDNVANGGCSGAMYLEVVEIDIKDAQFFNNSTYFQMISKSLIVAHFVEMRHFLAMVDLYLYQIPFQMAIVFGHCLVFFRFFLIFYFI